MAGYTIRSLEEIPDVLGDYPGEMRMSAASDLGTEQVGFTWRRMPPLTGGKGSYGHRHRTQEEVYFVASGTLQFKEFILYDLNAGQLFTLSQDGGHPGGAFADPTLVIPKHGDVVLLGGAEGLVVGGTAAPRRLSRLRAAWHPGLELPYNSGSRPGRRWRFGA